MKLNEMEGDTIIIVPDHVRDALFESSDDDKKYAVFYKDGEEANDYYLSNHEAMLLAMELEDAGNDVIVAKLIDNEWQTVYETKQPDSQFIGYQDLHIH